MYCSKIWKKYNLESEVFIVHFCKTEAMCQDMDMVPLVTKKNLSINKILIWFLICNILFQYFLQAAMTNGSGIRQLSLGGHVGFDSLPDQLVNQAVTTGFTFNIMCVGETGLGKLFVY